MPIKKRRIKGGNEDDDDDRVPTKEADWEKMALNTMVMLIMKCEL